MTELHHDPEHKTIHGKTYRLIVRRISGHDVGSLMTKHDKNYHDGQHTALVDVNHDAGPEFYGAWDVVCPQCR